MIFPGQVTTYIADSNVPWEYLWVEFDGLRITEASEHDRFFQKQTRLPSP